MDKINKRELPVYVYGLMLVAECLMWGFSNAFSKQGMSYVTPLWCLAIRYFFSTLLFYLCFAKRFRAKFTREQVKPCVIIGFFTGLAFILGFMGLANTSATNCGFLMSLAAVFAPILSIPLLKTKPHLRIFIPVTIAAIGIFLISGGKMDNLRIGDLYAALCSIASAFMLISSSKFLKGVDMIVLCVIQCAVCFVMSLVSALIFEPLPDIASYPVIVWEVIAFLVVGCTVLAYILQNVALKRVSPTFGGLVFSTEPIFTAIFAFFMLDEKLTTAGYIGAALIIAATVVAGIFEQKDSKADAKLKAEAESQGCA